MSAARMRVTIGTLHAGDVLAGSGTEVLEGPSRGVSTPAGKVDLRVRNPRTGTTRQVRWGQHTVVGIR